MVATLDKGIRLNWQQEEIVEFIINAMRGRNRFIGCYGTAGTGKTFTAKYAVESIKRAGLAKNIGVLAPTNSACKTLKKAFDGQSNIQTIASALGLAPIVDAKFLILMMIVD
jgi:superfamily II DNA or RNA helicase